MTKPHNNNEKQERTIEIEITLIDKKNDCIKRGFPIRDRPSVQVERLSVFSFYFLLLIQAPGSLLFTLTSRLARTFALSAPLGFFTSLMRAKSAVWAKPAMWAKPGVRAKPPSCAQRASNSFNFFFKIFFFQFFHQFFLKTQIFFF